MTGRQPETRALTPEGRGERGRLWRVELDALPAAPWSATFVHGQTGQDVSEDDLTPGQFVRGLKSEPREDGTEYRALVSPDGASWYRYRSYEQPFVR